MFDKLGIYQIEAGSIVNHYFKSGDIELAIEKLGSIKMPSYDFVFVDRLLSLTGSFKQVKLTFDLLSLLLESRFSKRAVINGFVLLMISIKELAVDLDVHSVQYILLFVMAVHEGLLFPEDLVDIYRMIPSFCYGRRVIEEAAAILRVPLLESHSEFAGTYLFVSYHHQRSNVSMSDNDLAMTKIDPRAASYHRASCIRRTALGIPVEDPSKSQFNADLEEPEVNNIGQKSYKVAEVDSIIKRYFVNLSIHEAINSLSQLGLSNFHGFFIKRIITEAISGSNKDKECTSKLLSAMYGNIVTAREVYEGYAMLLDCLESLGKENRNAMQWVAVFVARGIVDDILPVSFISRSRGWLKDAPEACHALDMAELICSSPSSRAIIFENGWNCAYLLKDAILSNFLKKVIIQNMLKQCEDRLLITTSHKAYGLSMCDRLSIYQIEAGSIVNHYFKSGDIELAIEKLGSIKMPSYDFVFVERLLSLTGSLKQVKLTFDLLSLLLESRFSKLAVINGFVMLMISIKELALDLDVLFVKYLLLFVTAVLEGLLTPEDLVNIYGMIPSVCYGRIVIEEAAAILRVCLLPKIW